MRLHAIAVTLAGGLISAVAVCSAYAQYYGPGYYSGYAYSGPSYAYVAPTYPYAAPPSYGYVYAPPPTLPTRATSAIPDHVLTVLSTQTRKLLDKRCLIGA